MIKKLAMAVLVSVSFSVFATDNNYIDGPFMHLEEQPHGEQDDLYFITWEDGVALSTSNYYTDDRPGIGGIYGGEVTVPPTIFSHWFSKEVEVVAIDGFYRNGATVLRLPETIREINYTIHDCKLLEEVYLNDNLKELNGVIDCPKLSICPLPQSLEYVGDQFMSGLALKNIEFPPLLTTIGNKTFSRNYSLETLSLGNLVVAGDSCFNNLPLLKEVVLPETLEALGDGCFNYCWLLERITLPSRPIEIPKSCFVQCPNVRELTIYAENPYDFPDYLREFGIRNTIKS